MPSCTRRKLPPSALALVGFSQGTMMALHVGLRRAGRAGGHRRLFRHVRACRTTAPPEAVAAEITSRPPILLVHGDQDELIPVQALFHAAQSLAALECRSNGISRTGVGHGIDQEGLRHGGEFLARRFGL